MKVSSCIALQYVRGKTFRDFCVIYENHENIKAQN